MMRTLMYASVMLAWGATLSAQTLDVRELNTEQISRLDRARTVVLLTAGILEEHGPFLPSYSDGYQSEFIAIRVADAIARSGWTVLRFPDIPLGAFPASYVGGKFVFPGSYPVRMATLRAVFMDLATDLGEAGFKRVFVVTMHGGPTHNQALDQAAQYFDETYGGRMVHVTGFTSVVGAVPPSLFTSEQRAAEGFSIHADADEHSCLLFLRPISSRRRSGRPRPWCLMISPISLRQLKSRIGPAISALQRLPHLKPGGVRWTASRKRQSTSC